MHYTNALHRSVIRRSVHRQPQCQSLNSDIDDDVRWTKHNCTGSLVTDKMCQKLNISKQIICSTSTRWHTTGCLVYQLTQTQVVCWTGWGSASCLVEGLTVGQVTFLAQLSCSTMVLMWSVQFKPYTLGDFFTEYFLWIIFVKLFNEFCFWQK